MVVHYKSFIGKHFCTVIQAAPFVFFPFITKEIQELWTSLCYVGSLIFQTDSTHGRIFQDLKNAIRSLLYHMCKMNARWVNKEKIHMSIHLPESIIAFGSLSLFATEKFESYNGILINSSVHSKRLGLGPYIAITFSNYNMMCLLLSGTYYYDVSRKKYRQASPLVQELCLNNEQIQNSIGFHAIILPENEQIPTLHDHKVNPNDEKIVPQALKIKLPNYDIRQISAVSLNEKDTDGQGTFIWVRFLL